MARKVFGNEIKDGQTFTYTAVVKNEAAVAINLTLSAALTSMVYTLYNKATGVHVGSRTAQDVLGTPSGGVYPGANNHTLASNGTLTYKATTGDTSGPTTADITYVARYVYVFPDAAAVARTAIHEFEFTVKALDVVS